MSSFVLYRECLYMEVKHTSFIERCLSFIGGSTVVASTLLDLWCRFHAWGEGGSSHYHQLCS